MKQLFAVLLFIAAISLDASISLAQLPTPEKSQPSPAVSQSREDLLKALQTKRDELQQLEKQFLSPSPEDQQIHAAFLSQPNTGLIRLLPRETYDSEAYTENKKTLSIRGAGAFYSFTRLTHEYGSGSDIALMSGSLGVGFAGANYGMLVNLGEISLDEITLEHPRVNFMSSYKPPAQDASARSEAHQFGKGVTVGDLSYSTRVPVKVNNTYLLRSIDYSNSDVLVAFRVVRQDSDGSVILAWKLLKKYPAPMLARSN